MNSGNNLEKIAIALGDLLDDVLFVGASINYILVDEAAKADIRETVDVDAVAKVTTYTEMMEFEQRLSTKGFKISDKQGDPACRWYFDELQFDLVALNAVGAHPTNRWYDDGSKFPQIVLLPSGIEIKILNPAFFIASKLTAFNDRGDPKQLIQIGPDKNHDLEDVIILLDGRSDIKAELDAAPHNVAIYIENQFQKLSQQLQIEEYIANSLTQPNSEARVKRVVNILSSKIVIQSDDINS